LKHEQWCVSCGGPIDRQGRTLSPRLRLAEPAHVFPTSVAPTLDDDPLQDLSPVVRFNQAIDRRNQLVRDRRAMNGTGRRGTDRVPLERQP
jgi:hypothetical protein